MGSLNLPTRVHEDPEDVAVGMRRIVAVVDKLGIGANLAVVAFAAGIVIPARNDAGSAAETVSLASIPACSPAKSLSSRGKQDSIAAEPHFFAALQGSIAAEAPFFAALQGSIAAEAPFFAALQGSIAAEAPFFEALQGSIAAQPPCFAALQGRIAEEPPSSRRCRQNRCGATLLRSVAGQHRCEASFLRNVAWQLRSKASVLSQKAAILDLKLTAFRQRRLAILRIWLSSRRCKQALHRCKHAAQRSSLAFGPFGAIRSCYRQTNRRTPGKTLQARPSSAANRIRHCFG
jgi:hypothetical protein